MKGHKHHKNNNKVGNVKEAKRRLGDILTNVQKMALSADDLSRLKAVRKLTQRTVRYPRRLLPLLAGLLTVLMVLIMYSVEVQGLDFRKNISVRYHYDYDYLETLYQQKRGSYGCEVMLNVSQKRWGWCGLD